MNTRYDPMHLDAVINAGKPSPQDVEIALWREEIGAGGSRHRFQWAFGRVGQLRRSLVAILARQPRATTVIDRAIPEVLSKPSPNDASAG